MIRKVVIQNFRLFEELTVDLNPGLNILVGNNEAGKSTLLEAINLALTARIGRNHISTELSEHLINLNARSAYLAAIKRGECPTPPAVLIEVYLEESKDTASLKGTNNSLRQDCPGICVRICFDDAYQSEYAEFLKDPAKATGVPIEYYSAEWLAFSGSPIVRQALKVSASLVDSSRIRLRSGSDYLLQCVVRENLSDVERVRLARAYRELRETFAGEDGITAINSNLASRSVEITDKRLSMSIDVSPDKAWETSLVPHLGDVPLHYAGGGDQSTLKILLALSRQVPVPVVLIEEPENHLAHPRLTALMDKIAKICQDCQVVITTHSTYVLNKLGLGSLLLLKGQNVLRLTDLPDDTQAYFRKLPGYDTLRVAIADRVVLVEGPSDELVVQRAFLDRHGSLPAGKGVDVISAGGLSFRRFLDVASRLGTAVAVVTDNDRDPKGVAERYQAYVSDRIRIFYGDDPEYPSLEGQLLSCNSLETLMSVFGRQFASKDAALTYMKANKTDAAIQILDSQTQIAMPEYIRHAVDA
jgi:ABC-type cobalamin/Fe3+-siderophores transport system ATPase subunit